MEQGASLVLPGGSFLRLEILQSLPVPQRPSLPRLHDHWPRVLPVGTGGCQRLTAIGVDEEETAAEVPAQVNGLLPGRGATVMELLAQVEALSNTACPCFATTQLRTTGAGSTTLASPSHTASTTSIPRPPSPSVHSPHVDPGAAHGACSLCEVQEGCGGQAGEDAGPLLDLVMDAQLAQPVQHPGPIGAGQGWAGEVRGLGVCVVTAGSCVRTLGGVGALGVAMTGCEGSEGECIPSQHCLAQTFEIFISLPKPICGHQTPNLPQVHSRKGATITITGRLTTTARVLTWRASCTQTSMYWVRTWQTFCKQNDTYWPGELGEAPLWGTSGAWALMKKLFLRIRRAWD